MKDLDPFTKEVKKIEEEASNIIDSAYKDKDKIISQAKVDAVERLDQKKKEYQKELDASINKEKARINKEKDLIIKNSQSDLAKIKNSAKKNMDKAVDYVISRLNKKIEDLK